MFAINLICEGEKKIGNIPANFTKERTLLVKNLEGVSSSEEIFLVFSLIFGETIFVKML